MVKNYTVKIRVGTRKMERTFFGTYAQVSNVCQSLFPPAYIWHIE